MKKLIAFLMLAGVCYGADTIVKYSEDESVLVAKLPVGEATQTVVDSINTDIQTLGDVTNSYVVVNGNVLLYDGYDNDGHPVYGTAVLAVSDGMWNVMSYGRALTNTIVGYFPPMFGWCDYETGTPTNLNIRFYSGIDALQQAQIDGKVSTNAITQTVTTNATEIPSGAAVTDALALKAGTTNAVLSWTATANTTNYVYTEFWDATNNVKRFTRTP